MKKRLKDDYSFFSYLFLGIITLDIYSLWCLHHLTKDLNEVYRDSGKRTPGIFALLLLSLVTCGLYSIFWWFRIADMLEKEVRQRGLPSDINPKMTILCMLLNYISFGIAGYVNIYQILNTMNEIASDYNSKLIDKAD